MEFQEGCNLGGRRSKLLSVGKPLLTIMISDSLVEDKKANASTIIREAAKEIQGGAADSPTLPLPAEKT